MMPSFTRLARSAAMVSMAATLLCFEVARRPQ